MLPGGRKDLTAYGVAEAVVDQNDHTAILLGSYHASRRLHDAVERRIEIGVILPLLGQVGVIGCDHLAFRRDLRKSHTNDHRTDQAIAHEIHALRINTARHGKADEISLGIRAKGIEEAAAELGYVMPDSVLQKTRAVNKKDAARIFEEEIGNGFSYEAARPVRVRIAEEIIRRRGARMLTELKKKLQ